MARPSKHAGAPPGWSVNPASWKQRLPIVALAFVGFLIASYLALFQYEVIDSVWEPFFGDGSRVILTSPVSDVVERTTGLPITDGALGAFGYLLDAVTGSIGGTRRYRTMPWMVILFGLAVGPLGAVSIGLVILQPVLFETWCTLCLVTALISVLMIGPAMDEVLASLQHVARARREGRSAWRALWGLDEKHEPHAPHAPHGRHPRDEAREAHEPPTPHEPGETPRPPFLEAR